MIAHRYGAAEAAHPCHQVVALAFTAGVGLGAAAVLAHRTRVMREHIGFLSDTLAELAVEGDRLRTLQSELRNDDGDADLASLEVPK